MVECEDRNAGSNKRDNEVFVQRVALAEDGEMKEHDG